MIKILFGCWRWSPAIRFAGDREEDDGGVVEEMVWKAGCVAVNKGHHRARYDPLSKRNCSRPRSPSQPLSPPLQIPNSLPHPPGPPPPLPCCHLRRSPPPDVPPSAAVCHSFRRRPPPQPHHPLFQHHLHPQIHSFAAAPNHSFHRPAAPRNPQQLIQRIESAAANAHCQLLSASCNISAWSVAESTLISLNAESWTALAVQLQDVPTLHCLLVVEGKVGVFIHCFVGARRIMTLSEFGVAICKNEGIEKFEELGFGLLVWHPLIKHHSRLAGS